MTEITGWIFPNTLATTKEKTFWKCWAYLVQIHQNGTPKKKNLLTVYFSSSRINYKYFHNIKFSSSCNKYLPTNKLMLDLLTTVPFTLQTLVPPQLWGSTWSYLLLLLPYMRSRGNLSFHSHSEPAKGWWLLMACHWSAGNWLHSPSNRNENLAHCP